MKLKEQKQENPEGDTAAALKILGIIIAGAILAMIIGNIRRKKEDHTIGRPEKDV
jgi:hypothetical protein